jgi:hypothetical protein
MKINGYEIGPKADLSEADLSEADLIGANLSWANLSGANLSLADLSGTCLAHVPGCTPAALAYLGWEVRGQNVYGWRTAQSAHVGDTHYRTGQTYEAPYLSCSRETACHPGIYILPTRNQARNISCKVVRVRARCSDVVLIDAHRTKGVRTKRLEVIG